MLQIKSTAKKEPKQDPSALSDVDLQILNREAQDYFAVRNNPKKKRKLQHLCKTWGNLTFIILSGKFLQP